jgi:adenylate cyclase
VLDQTSLDWGKEEFKWSWPWDRTIYTPIIDFCKRGGAKAVMFDVLFTEPSKSGVSDDQALGDCITSNAFVAAALIVSREQGQTTQWPSNVPDRRYLAPNFENYLATSAGKHLLFPRSSFSIPEVSTNVLILGHVFGVPDQDGKTRRAIPFLSFDGRVIPSLGIASFMAVRPRTAPVFSGTSVSIGEHSIPLDRQGRAILNFRGNGGLRRLFGSPGNSMSYQVFSAANIINSELRLREGGNPVTAPSVLKDKYVFFGYTAPGLLDLKSTPLSKIYPGLAVHATVLDNLLSNDFIREAGIGSLVALTILFGLLSGVGGRMCQNGIQSVIAFLVLLPLPLIIGLVAYSRCIWLQISPQEISIGLALVSTVILNYATEGKQKRFIKNAFKQYLSSEVIEKLVRNPEHLKLGGETRELSIFFSDVAGFTGISEVLTPEQLTALLNEYLTAMTEIIYSEGGTIDKYEGDAIIAFWNAPVDLTDHPRHAVSAAIRCNRKLAELRPVLKEKYGKDLYARVGINSGPVVVGNMGSTQRFNYTFLGDAGNLASRLEGLNKQFGTSVMISEFTYRLLGDAFQCREISSVRVVGRKIPIRVYEPMFKDDFALRADVFASYAKALKLYYEGKFHDALAIFSQLSDTDAPSGSYVKRCKDLIDHPPKSWDGVWEMKEK